MTASEVAAATKIQVGGTEVAADVPARARCMRRLIGQGRWLTAALTVTATATAIWVLSAHANRMNQHNAEAMRPV